MDFPPGFRFHPTDEEIIIHYLVKKVLDRRFSARAIEEADLNKCEPWDLAKMGEKEWFFCKKDRKYPTGMRTNRATESGYWKTTGKDREIYKDKNCLVGMKKTLVFYRGRAPKGEKTNWIMHEFRLEESFCTYKLSETAKEEWVVCRIFHKNTGILSRSNPGEELPRMDSFKEQYFSDSLTLPPLMDHVSYRPSSSFITDEEGELIKENSSSAIPDPNPDSYSQFSIPDPTFPCQASLDLPFQDQDRISSMFKTRKNFHLREFDQTGLGIVAQNQGIMDPGTYKMEQFSTTNSMVTSVSQDTARIGVEMANEMTTVVSKGETVREKPFDDFEGLLFSPTISDLDYLWSY